MPEFPQVESIECKDCDGEMRITSTEGSKILSARCPKCVEELFKF